MQIDENEVKEIDLKYYSDLIPDDEHRKYWLSEAGIEHYKLLVYLSIIAPKDSLIADLGSREGMSALALAYNSEVKVLSYDLTSERIFTKIRRIKNITFIEGDALKNIESITKCQLILLDIDPHDGIQEEEFINLLIEAKYKGMVLCDDIHLNLGMKNFWYKIKLPKEDLTNLGHHSGTGLVIFE